MLGTRGIEESFVDQAISAKGRAKAASEILIRLGRKEWGEPDERVRNQIMAIEDRARLEVLIVRIFDASATSWDELLPPAESAMEPPIMAEMAAIAPKQTPIDGRYLFGPARIPHPAASPQSVMPDPAPPRGRHRASGPDRSRPRSGPARCPPPRPAPGPRRPDGPRHRRRHTGAS